MKIIELLKQEKTLKQVANELNISYYKLRKNYLNPLKINGYKRLCNQEKYKSKKRDLARARYKITRNSYCFQKVDQEIKAYLLGLISADGNLYKDRISMASKDLQLIKIFSDYFQAPTYINQNIYHCGFKDVTIMKDLKKLGLNERKSYNLGLSNIFNNISTNLKHHFIRGFMDGDGSVCTGGSRYTINFTSTDKKLLEDIKIFLNSNKNRLFQVKDKKFLLYGLNISRKKNFFMVYHKLYDNANYFLERKKISFFENKR